MGKDLKEHLKALPQFMTMASIMGHNTSVDKLSIVGREAHTKTVKGAIFIKVNDPSLNRIIGKY